MVRISVGSPTHHTSGRLYGVFFEDINHGADGGLNANMVNNYSFDGVYLDHHTWRMAGAERWRTQADSLRFWDFINFFYLEEKLLIIFAEKSRYTLLILIEESIGIRRK